ncbi:MAG: DUF3987 domain-containing protein [Thermodesulfobacteriota bacterium]
MSAHSSAADRGGSPRAGRQDVPEGGHAEHRAGAHDAQEAPIADILAHYERLSARDQYIVRPSVAERLRALGVEDADELLPDPLGGPSTTSRDDVPPLGAEADPVGGDARGKRAWPSPPAPEAYHGLAGDIVRAIEPDTEADSVALLAHVLAGYGSMINRQAHYRVEDTEHRANEYYVLVGATAKGRKGTAERRIRRLLRSVDEAWDNERVVSGLSSGEGLLWAVRDAIYRPDRNRKTGMVEQVLVDPGIADKRLLVIEPEIASALRAMQRQGNTLSPILRRAWDGEQVLAALTKNSPARATGAHISVIAHVTEGELRRELDAVEQANGYGNRHLYLCVRRARVLPFGGGASTDLAPLVERLERAVKHGRATGRVAMDAEAADAWTRVYPVLSGERPGLLGALTARAEAHVVRLALLYALLDCASEIQHEHLLAALALWAYAEASTQYVFGDATGDPIADEILEALRRSATGLTRTEIRDLFGRHHGSGRLGGALVALARAGLATVSTEQTGGRPAERWRAA